MTWAIEMQLPKKACTKCGATKPLSDFPVLSHRPDGRHTRCRVCNTAATKAWYEANKGHVSAKSIAWRRANPARRKAISRKYRDTHPEWVARVTGKWLREHPERARELRREWASKNPEKTLAMNRNAKARRRGAPGKHGKADIDRLLSLQRRRCAACAKSLAGGYHVDHIEALASGGANDPKNLQLLCQTCNLKKGAKHPVRFMQEMGRLL